MVVTQDSTHDSTNANESANESAQIDRKTSRKALLALGVGGFAIGTGEFVIMGLLPDAARDLSISIPEAGHLISAYALGVVVGAPLLAVLGARWPRRNLLLALMTVFAIGNFASAVVPSYGSMLIARLLTGFPHGTYFGVAALVAASLVPRHARAQAVGLVMLGLTTATLIGVPIAAAIGQWLGWRSAFALVGAIGVLTVLLVWRWVPFVAGDRLASPLRELSALARKQVWLTLGIGAIGFGGMFAVFSYIKPTMIEVAHMSVESIPFVLALFGVGMVGGNLIGSRLADKALMPTIGGLLAWSALVLGLFVYTAPHAWLASANVLLIGTIVAIGPALQIRLMDVAGEAQTLAAALNHSAFNMANALGAWLGGVTISAGFGWTSTGWVGLVLAIGGLLVYAVSASSHSRSMAMAAR
ncbi:MFS transporter [Cupriavidus plantarum]|uniref:DHA1 family inner membrane transport protein n=1 Tax=Cupriavidus plantarum TaxID=942865 RepID=A0A316ENA5_9BURK|nr:MFS transporter [Cupriavidus plantarum]NYI01481.1 DHA1 family inner membrane transport protein [Cupriavidus plantarum]PWK32703.1 DHA1 family inner membrane transport protein [Cupriavidus plantarum]REE90798.1 DHA1 family inner membrane transport protein [Cupriavidus plantarum]